MSLRSRIDRLTHRLRTNGTCCPCGRTGWWEAWGPIFEAAAAAIHTDRDAPFDEDDRPPRCPKCGWLVPRPTIQDVRAVLAESGMLDDDAESP